MPGNSRKRGSLFAAGVAAALAVAAAVSVWTSGQEQPTSLPVVESHGLTPDQAACLGYGLVVRHSDAIDLTLRLGKYQSLDPDAEVDLQHEISDVLDVASDHPAADMRLVSAFDEVTAEGVAAVVADDLLAYRDAVTGRSAELAQARDTCLEVADFDVETLTVSQGGLP